MIDKRFLVKVALLMLPQPRFKTCPFEKDRAESLKELPIIKVGCTLNEIE